MKILFLGDTDSTLSQMAKAMLGRMNPNLHIFSAGVRPGAGIHPFTHKVMLELGLPLSELQTKSIERLQGHEFDFVVTFSNLSWECKTLKLTKTGQVKQINLSEPAEPGRGLTHQLARFRQVRSCLVDFVTNFYFADLGPAYKKRV